MSQTRTQTQQRQIVIMNALPLNALPRSTLNLSITPVSLKDLADWIKRKVTQGYVVTHYIRHSGTIAALRSIGIPLNERPNEGLYKYRQDDILVVVSLRSPTRGQDIAEVKPEDLDAWVVFVS